ncbi:MAG: HAMP domain-containing histidine kinase [Candidatus Cloacimonetes bacterium]|nr:HAMP domain-containing histidine kinase [Candidatus Cloacimonadota bacterium]
MALLYIFHFKLIIPIKSPVKSYFIHFNFIHTFHFINLKGKISKQINLPKKYSNSKSEVYNILSDLSDTPILIYHKNFLLFKYTVYEIQSRDESEIIQRISHDMKNQVLMMKMLTDQYAEEVKEKNQTYLDRLTNSIDNISQAAQTLSKFSHIDKLYKEKVELNMFIRQVLMNHVEHNNFHCIEFESSKTDIYIIIDENLFRIALDNLIMNALEEVTKDQNIKLKLQKLKSEILLTISNPINQKEYQSEEFGNVGYSSKPKGSGIGLPIAKVIIERHEGELDYFVSEGDFCVLIKLPFKPITA